MFATIRKNQPWLLGIVVFLTIGSFFLWNTKTGGPGGGGGNRTSDLGTMAGKPITLDQLQLAEHEVCLQVSLGALSRRRDIASAEDALNVLRDALIRTQEDNSAELRRQALVRMFVVEKARELGVNVTTEDVATYAQRVLSGIPLDMFEFKVLRPARLDIGDFERFNRNQLLSDQLSRTVGVPGKLVTPQEAETMFRLENQEIQLQVAYFKATNYADSVPVSPQALASFYTNRMADYRLSDQVRVEYVKINVTNFFPEAEKKLTNLTQILEYNQKKLGTNLFPGSKTPEESKVKLRNAVIADKAIVEARRVASEFAEKLDAMPHTLDSFHSLASSRGLEVKVTKPFEKKYGPEELDVPTTFASSAFSLTSDDIFSPSIVAQDGVYVLALKDRIPSHTPELKEIQAKVEDDYRYAVGIRMAGQSIMSLNESLSNGIPSGKSFRGLCEGVGVTPYEIPAMSLNTRAIPEDLDHGIGLEAIRRSAFATKAGNVSAPAEARDGAFMVYVVRQLPFDETKLKTGLPSFLAGIRQERQGEAFNLWLQSEANKDPAFGETVKNLTTENKSTKSTARRTGG